MIDIIVHLKKFIQQIAVDRNPYSAPQNHKRIINEIYESWIKYGLQAELIIFEHKGYIGRNLWVPPKNIEKPYFLLIAHHDTVPNCPGANDNGSGMAIVDYFAKQLKNLDINVALLMTDFEEGDPSCWEIYDQWQKNELEDYTWADMTFGTDEMRKSWIGWKVSHFLSKLTNDEAKALLNNIVEGDTSKFDGLFPSFIGTNHMINHLKDDYFTNLISVINFEMVGFTSDTQSLPDSFSPESVGDFIAVIGNQESIETIENLKQILTSIRKLFHITNDKGESRINLRRSDHAVFWDKNLPAIVFTDTGNFRNPHYHRLSDTEITINFDFMLEIVKLINILFLKTFS